jgi:hypothetical protein
MIKGEDVLRHYPFDSGVSYRERVVRLEDLNIDEVSQVFGPMALYWNKTSGWVINADVRWVAWNGTFRTKTASDAVLMKLKFG